MLFERIVQRDNEEITDQDILDLEDDCEMDFEDKSSSGDNSMGHNRVETGGASQQLNEEQKLQIEM